MTNEQFRRLARDEEVTGADGQERLVALHPVTQNWRDAKQYDYSDDLVRSDWAWEALRRNHEFRKAWSDAETAFELLEERSHLRVLRMRANTELARWGCLFADNPRLEAPRATVLWRPDLYARVLPMEARPVSEDLKTALFRIEDMQCNATILLTRDSFQHMLVRDGRRGFQLRIHGHSVLEPVRLVADAVLDPKEASVRLKTIQCFNDLRATGKLVPSHFPTEPATPRLRRVMQALDGALSGASHREIAEVLFGKVRVDGEWRHANNHLRDHVRRAIKRGEALVRGGYMAFLR